MTATPDRAPSLFPGSGEGARTTSPRPVEGAGRGEQTRGPSAPSTRTVPPCTAEGPRTIHIEVRHPDPVGQGNIRYNSSGHGYHQNAKRLTPWRNAILHAACAAARTHPFFRYGDSDHCARCLVPKFSHGELVGPLSVYAVVTVPKPKSAPKRRRTWPVTRSSHDADHHARAILDALTQASLWLDDSQVIDLHLVKAYPGEHPDALDVPGARITVRTWWP